MSAVALPTYLRQRLAIELPPYLQGPLDRFLLDLAQQAFENGRKAGEKEAFERLTGHRDLKPTIGAIQRIVAEDFALPLIDMTSDRQSRNVARPRQVAIFLCRQYTDFSLKVIGKHFGGRDHTTVSHAISTVNRLAKSDLQFADRIARIRSAVESAFNG
jgi:chromosomal replication initiation ATPase DnaA